MPSDGSGSHLGRGKPWAYSTKLCGVTYEEMFLRQQQLLKCFGMAVAVSVLVAQPAFSQVVQVTGVQLNPTANGLEIILETPAGEQLQVLPRIDGNTYIADIPNTQLRPPSSNTRQDNPVAGITAVTVTQAANSIRVTVTGSEVVPTVELFDSDDGLIFSFMPAVSSREAQPQQKPSDTLQPESETQQETTQQGNETPSTPEAVEPGSEAQPDETSADEDEPIEIVVTGEQEGGYIAPSATTGTRTDTPLRDIPQSIQVVPEQVLEDRQVIRVGDALENVSGVVNQEGGYSGYEDLITIRGFVADAFQGNYFRDGIRSFTFGFPETANLERIEVLKGPASVLYGQAQPGGIINLVTKEPLSEPYYSLEATVGNYDTYRGGLDISSPLNEDETLLYRLNGFYNNSDSFRDFVESERYFLAPVLTWEIGPNTSLKVDAEFIDDSRTMDDGIPVIGDRPADIPRSRFLSEPFSNFSKREYSVGYVFNHRFSENWSVRNASRAQWLYPERYYPFSDSLDESTGELSRSAYWAGGDYSNYSTQTDFIGKFATGSIQHQILFGFEYGKTHENPEFRTDIPYPSINIFNPVYIRERYPREPNFFRDDTTTTLGIYIQDQITLLPNLKLLLGGRFDSFDQNRSTRNLGEPKQEFEQSDSDYSPRVGIVYQPSEEVSLYASYTRSFRPSFGTSRNFDDSTFEPETGSQIEVGIKADFFDGRLSTTLAAFDLKKQNVVTEDPSDRNFSIQTGEQTSRGIELDILGEILPGWNIIASAAYIDAFISEDNTLEVGNRLDNVAEFSSSLWTTYEIQNGDLQGLGFGLGLLYIGDRQGDLANSFVLPSYLRTDAAIYYRRNNWRAALNIKNLFDVNYFTGSSFGSRVGVQPGAPFTILGTFSVEF